MATLGADSAVTLRDVATQMEGTKVANIIDTITEKNEIMDDMLWVECNDGSDHQFTRTVKDPVPYWRAYNEYVQSTKAEFSQGKDTTGMLEAWSKVDRDLARKSGNVNKFRADRDRRHIHGLSKEVARVLFYGDTRNEAKTFDGLSPRFVTPSTDYNDPGSRIINGGGVGSTNTSIWLVGWGSQAVHGIYPQGSQAGLEYQNLGEVNDSDGKGGEMQVYKSHFKWDCGLCIENWKYLVRIANIDVTKLGQSDAPDLVELMIRAHELFEDDVMGSPVFYCSRAIRTYLRLQILNKSNVNLTYENVAGKRALVFDESIPVRRCDALLDTEAAVTGF